MDLKAEIAKLKQSTLARNAGWMFLGQGLGLMFQATYFIVLARLLGSREYGIYAGTFALVSMASQYSTIGSGTIFLRYVSPDKSKFPIYWGNILIITCTFSIVVSAVLYVTARFILNPLSAALIFPAAVSVCFCTQIAVAAGQVFQAFEQLRVTAMMNLLTNIMRAITALTMLVLMHHATAWNWVVVSLFVSLAGAVIAVVTVTVRLGKPKFDLSLLRRHAAEGLQYSFSQSTSSAYNDVDKTMLSHYSMNVQNGIYSMAYRVVEIASIPVFAVRDAATPKFFQQGARGVTHSAILANSLLKRAMLLGVFSAACIFLLAPIIPHVIGKDYAESVYALRWLSLIPFFRSIHQMTGTALMGAGLQKYRTYTQIVAAAVNFLLNFWLIRTHGWQGAAWSSLLTDAALAGMNYFMLQYACRMAERKAAIKSGLARQE
jgi:O-antigen/teichoic acid export membrane protein